MCFEYDEYNQVSCETWRCARKSHKCESCRREICVGDKYLELTGINYVGRAFRLRACGRCMAQQDAIKQAELAKGCPVYSAICAIEDIAQHVLDSGMEWVSDEVAAAFAASKYDQQRKVTT